MLQADIFTQKLQVRQPFMRRHRMAAEREILFSLAQSLYKVAPQNSLALHLVMNKALEDNDYQLVLIYAEELLKQNPQMSLAIRSKLQALEELNRFNDGVSYTRAYLKDHRSS